MTPSQREPDVRLRRLFTRGFSVMDLAEPLVSFDAERAADEVAERMAVRDLRVVGVRHGGIVDGWVARDDLRGRTCGDHAQPFRDGAVLDDDACLPAVFEALIDDRYAFVRVLGEVGGIVSRSDVGKPAVRMWLFGMVTILESYLCRAVRERFPGEAWRGFVTPGRIEKAEALRAERARRGEAVDLVDCLQLPDKAHVLLRDPEMIADFGVASRREGKQVIKQLESLRNNLAHAQDIVGSNWETILRVSMRMDRILSRA